MNMQEYQVQVHHYRKRSSRSSRSSSCMQRPRKQRNSHNFISVPKIPSWEKDFCYKIGFFTWDKFLKAKKLTKYSPKILEWNDSAAEEAFHNAKNSFFAQINGLPNPNQSINPNPDLYIDEIDWDKNDDDKVNNVPELSGSVSSDEEEDDCGYYIPDYGYDIRIEDIKPTGWDIDVEEFSAGKVLTGLVIGG